MPGKAAKSQLSKQQLAVLTEFSKSRSLPQFISLRAIIVCLADEGHLIRPSARRSD